MAQRIFYIKSKGEKNEKVEQMDSRMAVYDACHNHRQRKGRERIYYTAKGEKRTSYSNPADCYECSTYNLAYQKYDRHCTCHHISTKALKSIILKTIQETCHYVSLNEREFVYSLQEESAMKDMASAISKIPKRKMSCLPLLKMWNSFFIVSGIMIL